MMAATTIPSDNEYRFYATAWLTVHYLMNHHADELRAYETALNAPPSGTSAWNRAFPTLTPAQLEWDLRDYRESGQYSLLIYPFNPPDVPVLQERRLAEADVHATRALVLAMTAGRRHPLSGGPSSDELRARAATELTEARRLEPGHLQGQAIARWMLGGSPDLTQARLAAQKQPKDWMAWALLADALEAGQISDGLQAAIDNAMDFSAGDRSVELSISRHTRLAPAPTER
jgi:tetratricopeptide (TPR) repeat protein